LGDSYKCYKKRGILVEEYFKNGVLARYLVVDGTFVCASEFTKPYVVGNGEDSIEELFKQKNELRKANPHLHGVQLSFSEVYKKNIKKQGYTLSSVLEDGKKLVLDYKANPHAGSDTIDITDSIHPLFKKVAEDAAKAIPNLTVAGIDLLAHNHSVAPDKNNYRIIEINHRPGLAGHIYPMYGSPRDVIEVVGEHILKTCRVENLKKLLNTQNNELLNSRHQKINIDDPVIKNERNQYDFRFESDTELIKNEFKKENYTGFFMEDFFNLYINDTLISIQGSLTSIFSFYAKRLIENSYRSRELLLEDGLVVSDGDFFKPNEKAKALKYANKFDMHVRLEYRKRKIEITSAKAFDKMWKKLSRKYKKHKPRKGIKKNGILITNAYLDDVKARYLIIDGRCVGVIQYITSKNWEIETYNITPYVHPELIILAEKAAKIVVGIDILGVDIVSKNHFKDPKKQVMLL